MDEEAAEEEAAKGRRSRTRTVAIFGMFESGLKR